MYDGNAFKRKTKIAEESANRGGTNWKQFTQGIPVVDAYINVPYFFLWNVIEKGAQKHCVKPKPDIGQVRWTKELKIEQRQKENAHSVCVCVISQ